MTLSPGRLVLFYAVFAILSIAINIGTQHVALMIYNSLIIAMIFGTGTGLVAKYILDKNFIFFDKSTGLKNHSHKFGLYTVMGLFTTAIFWGFEWAFHALFQSALMRDVGAVLGLTIGYIIKYQLDKRFVFKQVSHAS